MQGQKHKQKEKQSKRLTSKENKNLGLEIIMSAVTKDTIDVGLDTDLLVVRTTEFGQFTSPAALALLVGANEQCD